MSNNNDKIVVCTGGFDPIHSGHISMFREASKLGRLVVGLNSDDWLKKKKGRAFLPFEERKEIVSELKSVNSVISFADNDGTAINAIQKIKKQNPDSIILFANGGDRTNTNTPELDYFKNDPQVKFVYSIGGDNKKNSSSWILSEWKHPSITRTWGKFITYYDTKTVKVKRLLLGPKQSISLQRHKHRTELWFVESGKGAVYSLDKDEYLINTLNEHDVIEIYCGQWHRLENTSDSDNLYIIEIQFGDRCSEDDILRFKDLWK